MSDELTAESVREIVKDGVDEALRERETSGTTPIQMGAAQRDKHRSALQTAVVMRCFEETNCQSEETRNAVFPAESRAKGWEQFRHASLLDIAKECLTMDGVDIRGMVPDDIAMVALGFGDQVAGRTGPAYHLTTSFPIITKDALNKSMMLGFREFPTTWRGPFRQGQSVADFKTIHRTQLGAVPNLPIWNDNDDPARASFGDEEETYGIECRSYQLDFSYKTLVNDDMDVISRSPFKFGHESPFVSAGGFDDDQAITGFR